MRFYRSLSCRRALERGSRASWPMDKGLPQSCLSVESGRRFYIGVMAPGFAVSTDSHLHGFAQICGLLATEDSIEVERSCFLEQLNHFKLENEQLKKLILEKATAMKVMSTSLVAMMKMVAAT